MPVTTWAPAWFNSAICSSNGTIATTGQVYITHALALLDATTPLSLFPSVLVALFCHSANSHVLLVAEDPNCENLTFNEDAHLPAFPLA